MIHSWWAVWPRPEKNEHDYVGDTDAGDGGAHGRWDSATTVCLRRMAAPSTTSAACFSCLRASARSTPSKERSRSTSGDVAATWCAYQSFIVVARAQTLSRSWSASRCVGAVAQVTGGEERDKTLVEDLIVFKDQMDTVVDVAFARRQQFQHTLKVRRLCAWRSETRSVAHRGRSCAPAGVAATRRALRALSTSAKTSLPNSSVRLCASMPRPSPCRRSRPRTGVTGRSWSAARVQPNSWT